MVWAPNLCCPRPCAAGRRPPPPATSGCAPLTPWGVPSAECRLPAGRKPGLSCHSHCWNHCLEGLGVLVSYRQIQVSDKSTQKRAPSFKVALCCSLAYPATPTVSLEVSHHHLLIFGIIIGTAQPHSPERRTAPNRVSTPCRRGTAARCWQNCMGWEGATPPRGPLRCRRYECRCTAKGGQPAGLRQGLGLGLELPQDLWLLQGLRL